MDFETRAIHGRQANPLLDDDVAPPIHLSTTFVRDPDGTYPKGYSYTRSGNPNRAALEQTLASLEGGAAAACFASGTAATMAVFQSLAAGDHVLVPEAAYYGTREMLRAIFPRWGLQYDFIDMTDLEAVRRAMRPNTRMLWLETPSNPTLRITDVAGVVALARAAGALVTADNTVATPLLQRLFALGCDLVVHSTTKFINGHSDVLGGVVVTRQDDDMFKRIRTIQVHGGAVPSAFDCWLALRGVKTLAHRMTAHCANAQAVAEFLATQPAVTAVHYPGLTTHPQHALARRQMTKFGGLLSFEVRGGQREALAVVAGCRVVGRATSLGGVESTIEQRASMEGPDTKTPPNLLRMSVGLESASDLIQDLGRALKVLA